MDVTEPILAEERVGVHDGVYTGPYGMMGINLGWLPVLPTVLLLCH